MPSAPVASYAKDLTSAGRLPWMLSADVSTGDIQRLGLLQLLLPRLLGVAAWRRPSPSPAYHEEHEGWRQHGQVKSCKSFQDAWPDWHVSELCLHRFLHLVSAHSSHFNYWLLVRPVEPVMGMLSTPVYWSEFFRRKVSIKEEPSEICYDFQELLRSWVFSKGQKYLSNIIHFMQYSWN